MAFIDLYTTSNLLRYISEWDPRDPAKTKGGYMDGEIKIPNVGGKLKMIIQTYPAEDVPSLVSNIHPCLLHVVQIVKGRRDQDKEPVPTYYHWKQEFDIEDGKVYVCNKSSELDADRPKQVPEKAFVTTVKGNSIVLGKTREDLNLILLLPKQQSRAKATEASITDVLADRLETNDRKKIDLNESFFRKPNAKNLRKIRLRVDFYDENGIHCGWSISPQTIVDTGNKEIGSMDMYDATPRKSCIRGGRKIIMVSEYNLAKGVVPIFEVHDEYGEHQSQLDCYLTQPDQFVIKNQTIIFLTPPQENLEVLRNILGNFSIKLLAKRVGDGYTSNREFEFNYINHRLSNCPFCDMKLDTDGLVQIEAGIQKPKPGTKKRKIHDKDSTSNCKLPRATKIEELSPRPPSLTGSSSPSYNNEYPASSSDGGYNSEWEYTTTLTPNQLDNLVEKAEIVVVEDDFPLHEAKHSAGEQFPKRIKTVDEELGEFASEKEVRKALGLKVEEQWGQKGINEQYTDNIQNLPMEDLLQIYVPEPEGMQFNDIGDTLLYARSCGYNHTIQSDSTSIGKKCLLQKRCLNESTIKAGQEGSVLQEISKPEIKEKVAKERKQKLRDAKNEKESSCFEDLPLLTMIFMILLIIMNLVAEHVIEISSSCVIMLAMTCAMLLVFLKNKM